MTSEAWPSGLLRASPPPQVQTPTHSHALDLRSCGGVAEWFKAVVLKTTVPKGTGGSNPSSSAIAKHEPEGAVQTELHERMGKHPMTSNSTALPSTLGVSGTRAAPSVQP